MRSTRKTAAYAAASALVVAALSGPGAALADETNLVADGGFETGMDTWDCPSGSITTDPVHSGEAALSVSAGAMDIGECTQTVSVQPDSTYTLTASVSGEYVFLGEATSDTKTWGSGDEYTTLSTSFTTGSDQTSATVFLHGWYGQGDYLADDVSLTGPPGDDDGAGDTGDGSDTGDGDSDNNDGDGSDGDGSDDNGNGDTGDSDTGDGNNGDGDSDAGDGNDSGPSSGPASELPTHMLTGYWQDFVNGAEPLALSDVPGEYDLVAVAFADSVRSEAGAVDFHIDKDLSEALDGYSEADFTADIETLHDRGQKVIISVGGALGTISVASPQQAESFADSVNDLIDEYGFDGVDIDLENGIDATHMSDALHAIEGENPGTIITMAPQTIDMLSTSREYFTLALDVKDILTVVNTQYYNSGSMNGCDGGVYAQGTVDFPVALACTVLESELDASQVGLGFPASTKGAGSGYVSTGIVNDALTCLTIGDGCGDVTPESTYPDFRGAMTWSINWDASNGYDFADAVSSQLDALP